MGLNRLSLVGAWLILLFCSLTIGAIALRLLGHERERIATATRAAAMEHADAVAGSIALAVADVEAGLTRSLHALRDADLPTALLEWRRSNPLIRNVFVRSADGRMLLPDPARPGTDEAAEFLERYGSLLNDNIAWTAPAPDRPASASASGDPPDPQAPAQRSFRSQREDLVALSKGPRAAAQPETAARGGWIPWTWENRLHLLGWVEDERGRYGVELEVMAVLARLVESIPDPTFAGGVLALLDDRGQVMHQRGGAEIDADTPRLASVQIGQALPHWQVSIYAPAGAADSPGGQAMIMITGLVVATFVAAILLGGALLVWQAHRNLLDAQQKTNFVSNVSHELKTPLTTIRMYAELMGEHRVTDPAKRDHYLGVIVEESRRLTRLVNNVLDFSRLEQGRKRYRRDPMDLWEVLRELLETHGPRFERAGMSLHCDIPASPCPLTTDRDAVEQSLLNVLDNAIKYADRGGSLTVEAEAPNRQAHIRILDRGPGIPDSQRELVFKKFHRVDDSLTASRTGSGLGLSIARRLLRDLGGELSHAPRPGGGSCFTLILPLEAPSHFDAEAPA